MTDEPRDPQNDDELDPAPELAGSALSGSGQARSEDVTMIIRRARSLGSDGRIVSQDGRSGVIQYGSDRKPTHIDWD